MVCIIIDVKSTVSRFAHYYVLTSYSIVLVLVYFIQSTSKSALNAAHLEAILWDMDGVLAVSE